MKAVILSRGSAYARAYFLNQALENGKNDFKIEKEYSLYKAQVLSFLDTFNTDHQEMAQFQKMMLEDPAVDEVLYTYQHEGYNLQESIIKTFDEFKEKLEKQDAYFRDRMDDIESLKRLLLNALAEKSYLCEIFDEDVILVSKTLLPSDIFRLDLRQLKGVVVEEIGAYAHVVLLLKSLQIPLYKAKIDTLKPNHMTYLDEITETISQGNIKPVFEMKAQAESFLSDYDDTLAINLNRLEMIPMLEKMKVTTIGLVRTEMLFMQRMPSFKEQKEAYQTIMDHFPNVTFRTFDIREDKMEYAHHQFESFHEMVEEGTVFKTQIKAILSCHKEVSIMFPMVKYDHDLEKAIQMVKEIKENINYQSALHIGIMVETKEALEALDIWIKKLDFVSVGTSDLLASIKHIHRDALEDAMYQEDEMIQALSTIVQVANRENKKVTVCGLIASNHHFMKQLEEMGYRHFSLEPFAYQQLYHTLKIESKGDYHG